MTTYTVWEGPSMLDGTPIVLLISDGGSTQNRKTGKMWQTYILRQDMVPAAAYIQGLDQAVCGDCPLRGKYSGGNGACYVNVGFGPGAVWRAWQRGNAKPFDVAKLSKGGMLRLGAYGDPSAVPAEVWAPLVAASAAHTGYTRQWDKPWAQAFRAWCHASCQTEAEAAQAQAAGWKTFRVRPLQDSDRLPFEIVCPASAERGHMTTCSACLRCGGTDANRKGNVVITVHGSLASAL